MTHFIQLFFLSTRYRSPTHHNIAGEQENRDRNERGAFMRCRRQS